MSSCWLEPLFQTAQAWLSQWTWIPKYGANVGEYWYAGERQAEAFRQPCRREELSRGRFEPYVAFIGRQSHWPFCTVPSAWIRKGAAKEPKRTRLRSTSILRAIVPGRKLACSWQTCSPAYSVHSLREVKDIFYSSQPKRILSVHELNA